MGQKAIKIFGVLCIGVVLLGMVTNTGGASSTDWLTANLSLQEQKTYTLPQDGFDVSSVEGNKIPCLSNQFIYKPYIYKSIYNVQQEQKVAVCDYGVSGGRYGKGYLLKNGTNVAGQLKGAMSNFSYLVPIPGSSTVLELVSAGGIAYKIYVTENAYSGLTTTINQTTKEVTYKLPMPTATFLKNSRGDPLFIDVNTLALANNGQWLVADGLNTGFVRINIATRDILPFTSGFSNAAASNTVYSMNAISDDGAQVVVSAMAPLQSFNYYDLASCQPPLSGMIYRCQSRNLQNNISALRNKYRGGTHNVGFASNNLLQFYASYEYIAPNNRKIGLFTLSNTGEGASKLDYLALGDSFSSGEGVKNYRPETNTELNRCHTSYDSYGYVLSALLANQDSFKSIACSGAKIKDIVLEKQKEDDYNLKNSQAFGKEISSFNEEILLSFLPGYRIQNKFVSINRPKIITMSIGGNDIGFSQIIAKCVSPFSSDSTCYSYYEDRKELLNVINNKYQGLLDTYRSLMQASPDAKLFIVGYPQLAKDNGNCANNVRLDNNEIIFSNQLIAYLNNIIEMAADHAGAKYVDVEHAFDGHRMCETASYDVAANGVTAGRGGGFINGKYPFASESYHPNKLGHQLLANAIAAKTASLTAAMPAVNTSTANFLADTDNLLLQNVPHRATAAANYVYDGSISADALFMDAPTQLDVSADTYSLPPNSQFSVVMYSDPTVIGTIATDSSGNIAGTVNLPPSLPVGYHTLHITGKNILDEPVDIAKIVYVAATINDYDGDGVANSNETCLGIEPLGVDIDKDGVDDACDGFIDMPPPEPTPEPIPVPEPDPDPSPPPAPDPVLPDEDPQDTPLPPTDPPVQENQNPQDQNPPATTPPVVVEPPASPDPEIIPEQKLNDSLPALPQVEVTQPAAVYIPQIVTTQKTQVNTQPPVVTEPAPPVKDTPATTVAGISTSQEPTVKIAKEENLKTDWAIAIISVFVIVGIFLGLMKWAKTR